MRASVIVLAALAPLGALATPPAAGTAERPPLETSHPAPKPPAAPPAEAKPPASSSARALSRALVPRDTWDRLLDRSAQGLTQAVARSLSSKGTAVPDDLSGSIRRELGGALHYEDAVESQAQALDRRFTRPEMDSAARFYGSAVGKKLLERLPEAQGEVGDELQGQLASVVPGILHKVAPNAFTEGGPQAASPGAGAQPAPGAAEGTGSSTTR